MTGRRYKAYSKSPVLATAQATKSDTAAKVALLRAVDKRRVAIGKARAKAKRAAQPDRLVGRVTVEAARVLSESGVFENYDALRSCVVASFAVGFALAYGMSTRDVPFDCPQHLGPLLRLSSAAYARFCSLIKSLDCSSLMPEHFGHVHENLAAWKLDGRALVPSSERRTGGVHFTPRELTEPVVRKTLAPLFTALHERSPAESILGLRICDPACGAGAFLVEAIRQLAAALVAEGHITDLLVAKRMVAIHCVHGTDISRHAIESAKLAVWLECRTDAMPADWLDDNIKAGDALVGLNVDQMARFHWSPKGKDRKGQDIPEVPGMRDRIERYIDAARIEVQARKHRLSELAGC